MLRAGYVDVALIFRHEAEGPSSTAVAGLGNAAAGARRPGQHRGSDSTGTEEAGAGHGGPTRRPPRGRLMARGCGSRCCWKSPSTWSCRTGRRRSACPRIAPAVTELWPDDLARFADHRWIAGCDRCREHLLQQCAAAGYTPKIAFTTDDFVAVQALVTAGLGVALLPSLALSAARNPAVRVLRLRGTRRSVVAVRYGEPPDPPATGLLMGALRAASTSPADALPGTAVPAAASGWPRGQASATARASRTRLSRPGTVPAPGDLTAQRLHRLLDQVVGDGTDPNDRHEQPDRQRDLDDQAPAGIVEGVDIPERIEDERVKQVERVADHAEPGEGTRDAPVAQRERRCRTSPWPRPARCPTASARPSRPCRGSGAARRAIARRRA